MNIVFKKLNQSYAVVDIVPKEYDGEVVIPETYKQLPVTQISPHAFQNSSITSVFIPSSVEKICCGAFENCKCLKTVLFSRNSMLTIVESLAFLGCSSLEKIHFQERLHVLETMAFRNCNQLQCRFPKSCIVRMWAFDECRDALIEAYETNLPSPAENETDSNGFIYRLNDTRDAYVFVGRTPIHKDHQVIIPSEFNGLPVVALDDLLFSGDDQLWWLTIPATVTASGYFPFYGCDELISIYYEGTREAWEKMNLYTWFAVKCADDS
jgi:hypothetical protein